jgi:hypothetical protein
MALGTEHLWWLDELNTLTVRLAQQLAADIDPIGDRQVRLAALAAAHLLQTELEEQMRHTAYRAVEYGASYADLGTAVGMTRQGARRRWPGLTETTRVAQRQGTGIQTPP